MFKNYDGIEKEKEIIDREIYRIRHVSQQEAILFSVQFQVLKVELTCIITNILNTETEAYRDLIKKNPIIIRLL